MSEKHPFQVCVGENNVMGAFDVQLFVGGFATQDEADAYAKRLVEFLEREAGAQYSRVQ